MFVLTCCVLPLEREKNRFLEHQIYIKKQKIYNYRTKKICYFYNLSDDKKQSLENLSEYIFRNIYKAMWS